MKASPSRVTHPASGRCILLLLLLLSSGSTTFGDIVSLYDGRKYEGTILEETDSSVRIDAMVGGVRVKIGVPRRDVEKIDKIPVPADFYDPAPELAKPAARPAARPEDDPRLYLEVPIVGRFGVQIVADGVKKSLSYAVVNKISNVVFFVDSQGGDQVTAKEIYDLLQRYDKRITYHAVVRDSVGLAMAVTVWCDNVFLLPGANLGGTELVYDKNRYTGDPEVFLSQVAFEVGGVAEERGWPAGVVPAMIDPAARFAAWVDSTGQIVSGVRVPSSVPRKDVIVSDRRQSVLTLTRDQAAALGVARKFRGDAAALGAELGIEGWRAESDYGRKTMLEAARTQARHMDRIATRNESEIKRLLKRRDTTATLHRPVPGSRPQVGPGDESNRDVRGNSVCVGSLLGRRSTDRHDDPPQVAGPYRHHARVPLRSAQGSHRDAQAGREGRETRRRTGLRARSARRHARRYRRQDRVPQGQPEPTHERDRRGGQRSAERRGLVVKTIRETAFSALLIALVGWTGCAQTSSPGRSDGDVLDLGLLAKDFWQVLEPVAVGHLESPRIAIAEFTVEYAPGAWNGQSARLQRQYEDRASRCALRWVRGRALPAYHRHAVPIEIVSEAEAYRGLTGAGMTDLALSGESDKAGGRYPVHGLLRLEGNQAETDAVLQELLEEIDADYAIQVNVRVGVRDGRASIEKGSTVRIVARHGAGLLETRLSLVSPQSVVEQDSDSDLTAINSRRFVLAVQSLFRPCIGMALIRTGRDV